MLNENALVVYKNKPALVKEQTADKITIVLADGETLKVREKDIEIIHPGPVATLHDMKGGRAIGEAGGGTVREAWELLLAGTDTVCLEELAELAFGEYSPAAAWAGYSLLADGLYFTGTISAIRAKPQDEVEAGEKKREEKRRSSGEREQFLERLKNRRLHSAPEGAADDHRFMQDIEALAYGKSAKSRTMKDIGLGETPQEAHALLLECGVWTAMINPHPSRFGIPLLPAKHVPDTPEYTVVRQDLTHLAAFAIDSPWSSDPDDAISYEAADGAAGFVDGAAGKAAGKAAGHVLYVHVADPAAVIGPDSPAEKEARDRGATLYIPEGNFRMLADEFLPLCALGLGETSPALTFKMTIDDNGEINRTDIFPSTIKVSRLTYKEADNLLSDSSDSEAGTLLHKLSILAERSLRRRVDSGAVTIEMPETHISLNQGQVKIKPIERYRSAGMVRECMLYAGEGAGIWAMQHSLPFPYISQEAGDIPDDILPGMAGSYQLRRCMRPRTLSVKPGRHWGLGLDTYTQVTSPLRRYTDLLAHLQIHRFLRGEEPLCADEVSIRMNAGEAAALAVTQTERASRSHWTMVYLSDKKDSVWDAIALEKKGNRWAVIIPGLALETQVPVQKDPAPNDVLTLIVKSVNIPNGDAVFITH